MKGLVQAVSGVFVPLLLLLVGGYFAVMLLSCLARSKRGKGKKEKRKGGAGALALALAGTLGVGNIAGVGSALALGGPGAIFWMWISSLFAMALKYAEVVLALRTRRFDGQGGVHGGAPYYMEMALPGRLGKRAGNLFAVLCFVCSLTLGAVMQSAAAAEVMQESFSVPPLAIGIALGVGAVLILGLGAKGVERACTLIVPVICALFTVASLVAIFVGRAALPTAFAAIFKGAFSFQSGVGGVVGFFTSRALRYGVARGLVSNEAGCGTAPIAHALAQTESPVRQGLFGVVEVLVDTVLLCTMTALVILVSGVLPSEGGGMRYALAAYTALLGPIAVPLVSLCALCFAFATVLCWSHYGAESLYVLGGQKKGGGWQLVLILMACAWGAVAAPDTVWDVTDLVLGLMAILNMSALLLLHKEVRVQSESES